MGIFNKYTEPYKYDVFTYHQNIMLISNYDLDENQIRVYDIFMYDTMQMPTFSCLYMWLVMLYYTF